MKPVIVYVQLMGTASRSYRATYAIPVGDGLLRLLGPVPFGETWQFEPGEYIEYDNQEIAPGRFELTAVRSASGDPEFRKRRWVYAICGIPVGIMAGAYWTTRIGILFPGVYIAACSLGALAFAYASARWGDRAWYAVLRPIVAAGKANGRLWPF
jgi:hypothetical protein